MKAKQSKALVKILILASLGGLLAQNLERVFAQDPSVSCANKTQLFKVANRPVWKWNGLSTVFYKSGMTIDADGAPNAYHLDFGQNIGSQTPTARAPNLRNPHREGVSSQSEYLEVVR